MEPVRDFYIPDTIEEFFEYLGRFGGFTATMLYDAAKILEEMIKDDESTNFLSFPACIIATGCRGAIRELIKRKRFDVVITTCGTLDHDLARSFADYYHGTFFADDRELREKGIHRLGNVFIPVENYGPTIEKHMRKILEGLEGRRIATYELSREIGRYIAENSDRYEESLLYRARKNQIPVIVPGITDGAVGYQIRLYSQMHEIYIDVLKDETLLDEYVHSKPRSGALIIGGGISKHHVIRRNQFKGGLDRAVYITTAVERDGSLSGARTREAISRGKVRGKARHVTVPGEATVLVPLLTRYLAKKLTS